MGLKTQKMLLTTITTRILLAWKELSSKKMSSIQQNGRQCVGGAAIKCIPNSEGQIKTSTHGLPRSQYTVFAIGKAE